MSIYAADPAVDARSQDIIADDAYVGIGRDNLYGFMHDFLSIPSLSLAGSMPSVGIRYP